MRLWHYELLEYLPDAQFKGQLRELVAIMHDWRDKGETNHILINRVCDHPKSDLTAYFVTYAILRKARYGKFISSRLFDEFADFAPDYEEPCEPLFVGWHDKEYLRCNMANLYEKWKFAKGKSRITDEEWARLCDGYKAITGEEYHI